MTRLLKEDLKPFTKEDIHKNFFFTWRACQRLLLLQEDLTIDVESKAKRRKIDLAQ